jgi:hypothetical protein
MGKKIAEVRYAWYHASCYIRFTANRLYETTHIQQKATDKTLSIAYCTQICTRKETIYEREKAPYHVLLQFPMKSKRVILRYTLYNVSSDLIVQS